MYPRLKRHNNTVIDVRLSWPTPKAAYHLTRVAMVMPYKEFLLAVSILTSRKSQNENKKRKENESWYAFFFFHIRNFCLPFRFWRHEKVKMKTRNENENESWYAFFLLKPFQISSRSFSFFLFLLSYPRSFLLYTSFLLAGKVCTKSSVNPEKWTLISSRYVGVFK